jgi:hypothetical protein
LDLVPASDRLIRLTTFAKRELDSSLFGSGSYTANFSAVDEVATVAGLNQKVTKHQDPSNMRRQFFVTKVSFRAFDCPKVDLCCLQDSIPTFESPEGGCYFHS